MRMMSGRGQTQPPRTSLMKRKHLKQVHERSDLRSDRDRQPGVAPAAKRDQFGSAHNEDAIKAQQRRLGRPAGKQDLGFRESGQDVRRPTGARNKKEGRRKRKSGSPREAT